MLSISKAIRGFDQGEYYLRLAAVDDYYLDGKEPPGCWLGDGARTLGLSGLLSKEEFRNLFRGLSPDGEGALVHNARSPNRRSGWDLTWSVPKSVSTAWSQAPLGVRLEIERAVNAAVAEGVRYLESIGVVSRRGEDGVLRERARLIFAAFPHSTSRALDPQLHVHTILLNVAVRPDGSTGTIEPKELFRHQHAADAIFKAELAVQLEKRLGLRAVRVDRGFEVCGVDPGLMAAFSKRRQEIESVMAERGWNGSKAAEAVAFETRSTKVAPDREKLFSQWRSIGLKLGWSTKELSLLLQSQPLCRNIPAERDATVQASLRRVTEFDSHFALRDLTRAIAEEAQGRGLGANEVYALRDQLFQNHQVLPVGFRDRETRYSTPEMLELERAFLSLSRTLHAEVKSHEGATCGCDGVLARFPSLSDEQRSVVRAVTGTRGGIHLVCGMAGTGKTYAFRVANEVWKSEGLEVHGASLSGKAASGLQQGSDIPSMTLHRLLWGLNHGAIHLHSNSVVLVDEAAMVGTRQLFELTARCQEAGAKLVLAGDAGQLQSVEAGGGFAVLAREFGATTLTEIQRQREPWAREAVTDFAKGRSRRALSSYEVRGLLHQGATPESAERSLVEKWSEVGRVNCAENVILSGTNAEVLRLNEAAQSKRHDEGLLRGTPHPVGEQAVYVNDRVLFTRNSQALGVFNGDLGEVTARDGPILTVKLDHGRTVTVNTAEYAHLRLGYALTTHKAQGMTAEQAFVLAGRLQNREMTYVQASRARGTTRFFLGTKNLDWMAERMATSAPKELATTLLDEGGPKLILAQEP